MPASLPQLVRALTTATNPHDVLDNLQNRAGPLNVHSAWSRSFDHYEARDIVYHNSVSEKFRLDYQAEIQKNGLSPTTRLALTEPLSFTITEARQKLRPAGYDQWIFNLLQDHGMRDGFAVPRGNWVVLYWSPRVLNGLGCETRMALDASGAACIYRLKELMAKKEKPAAVSNSRQANSPCSNIYPAACASPQSQSTWKFPNAQSATICDAHKKNSTP